MDYARKKKKNQQILSLRIIKGDIILIGCQIEKHTKCMTTVFHIIVNYAEGEDNVHTYPFKHKCWYCSKPSLSALTMCLWTDLNSHLHLGLQSKINIEQPYSLTQPPIKLSLTFMTLVKEMRR